MSRNKLGHFTKGHCVWNKGKRGYTNKGSFKKGHELIGNPLAFWRKKGGVPWNKGAQIQTNTGKTHFKKGQLPHNYKGGISKTRAYKNFYNQKYKRRKRGALGSHTFGEWENLKAQYNWICPCCRIKEPFVKLTEDHVVPLSKGGSDNIENIQPLCRQCNSSKNTTIIKYAK